MKAIYFTIISLITLSATAATRTAVNNGNWSASATWGGTANIPQAGDSVVIPSGKTVTVSTTIDLSTGSKTIVNVLSGGTLDMNNGRRLLLPGESYVNLASSAAQIAHGGGGNNTFIQVGTDVVWNAGMGAVTGPQVIPASALPVILTSFKATQIETGVVSIEWVTAAEINNHYFDVERSTDLIHFEKVARVNGKGTFYNPSTYTAIDRNDIREQVYYRLVQVDFDGTQTIYQATALSKEEVKLNVTMYPNPSNGAVAIMLNENTSGSQLSVHITDLNGKTVEHKTMNMLPGTTSVSVLDGSENLKPGFYTVTIVNGTTREQLKLQITN